MPLSDSNLIYKTSVISKGFFWRDIENSTTPHKKFRVFLYTDKLVIGFFENNKVSFNHSIDIPPSVFTEDITLPLNQLRQILLIKNSNLFSRIYFYLSDGTKIRINLINHEAEEFLSHLKPLLPKKAKIRETSLANERLRKKLKIITIIGVTLIVAGILSYYVFMIFLPHKV